MRISLRHDCATTMPYVPGGIFSGTSTLPSTTGKGCGVDRLHATRGSTIAPAASAAAVRHRAGRLAQEQAVFGSRRAGAPTAALLEERVVVGRRRLDCL